MRTQFYSDSSGTRWQVYDMSNKYFFSMNAATSIFLTLKNEITLKLVSKLKLHETAQS